MKKRKKPRRSYSSEMKAEVLRAHFKDKKLVSQVCEEFEVKPSSFYLWRDQLLVNMATALESQSKQRRNGAEAALTKKVAALEAKLAVKDNVIAEISEEYVHLKKELGEP